MARVKFATLIREASTYLQETILVEGCTCVNNAQLCELPLVVVGGALILADPYPIRLEKCLTTSCFGQVPRSVPGGLLSKALRVRSMLTLIHHLNLTLHILFPLH